MFINYGKLKNWGSGSGGVWLLLTGNRAGAKLFQRRIIRRAKAYRDYLLCAYSKRDFGGNGWSKSIPPRALFQAGSAYLPCCS